MKIIFEKKHLHIDIKKNPLNINSYDIETYEDGDVFIPYLVVYNLNNRFYEFYGKYPLLRSIYSLFININKHEIIYIHNLDFDGFLIIEEISKNSHIKLDFFINKMKIYYIKLTYINKIIEFRCSAKILPAKLSDISKDFNLNPKMIFPYKFSNKTNLYYVGFIPSSNYFNNLFEWKSFHANHKKFNFKSYSIEYCKRDVEITKKFLEIFFNLIRLTENYNPLNTLTVSSLSLKIFAKNYNQLNLNLKLQKKFDSYIRESYMGGRVEIFGNTKHRVYHYDFPGMYGLVMLESFPISNPRFVGSNFNLDIPGFYSIKWKSNKMRIPVLPIKNDFGKLIFPNGVHSGTYWFEEINYFREMGGEVLEVYSGVEYEKMGYLFQNFIHRFNELRKEGGVKKTLGKLIINSLYGKMGSSIKNKEYKIYNKKDRDYVLSLEYNSLIEINNLIIIEIEKISSETGINVGIASAITSKARIKLHKAMSLVEKNGGRILYCDTDSMFIEFKNRIDYSISKWDKEDSVYDEALFLLPKTYGMVNKYINVVKIKGIRKDSISFEDFKTRFNNGGFLSFQEVLSIRKSNFIIRKGVGEKEINLNNYDKRIFGEGREDSTALDNN